MTPEGQRFIDLLTPDMVRAFFLLCWNADSYEKLAPTIGANPEALEVMAERMFERAGVDSRLGLLLFAVRNGIGPTTLESPTESSPWKSFRAYFNRKSEAPQVWSVDEGTQESEVNVKEYLIPPGCGAQSHWNDTPANNDTPAAWITVTARGYKIIGGTLIFY
ncbi:MAG TPA: hypothetical protein VGG42_09885 [Acidobacteriaceae bacterium]|jgi:hypothetical protein